MSETIFVTGVVIANGIADSDGDLLTKKDIKTIFTKYINRDTDTMHTNIKNTGVDVIANWISEVAMTIGGQNVPTGSWIATMKISNPQLIECIKSNKLRGFSLGSVSEEAMTPNYWFINKSMNYRDLESIEEVIPLFISLVDYPANQFNFEWMEYETYINKNNKNIDNMTENKEEMISVSALERIRDIFAISKSESEEEKEIEKEDETAEATNSADEQVSALFEKLDMIIEQNNQILEFINKEDEASEEESVDEEEEIEKSEEEADSEEEIEKADESSEEETDEEIEKSEEEASEDEDKSIEKRTSHMVENQVAEPSSTFYQRTGRDVFGRKIKN